MRQPPGFDKDRKFVYYLQKAIYGLKQSGCACYFEIHSVLQELGFKKFDLIAFQFGTVVSSLDVELNEGMANFEIGCY